MASCSIREELTAQYPTCIDYTAMSSPKVRAIPLTTHHRNLTSNLRSIHEDEDRELVHVMKYRDKEIDVYDYQGRKLFSYPNKNINYFSPRGMCICNNIVYITSPMINELLLFTTEGDVITLYNDRMQGGVKTALTRPRGVVSDDNNNIYICTAHAIVVMDSALPVCRNHVIHNAKPKEIKLFRGEIFILCWRQPGVSIDILSLSCDLIRSIYLSGFKSGIKPWYFDIDHYGNFVIPKLNLNRLYVYSKDGKMIVNQPLSLVQPRGIKLLNNKRSIGISSCSPFGFCIF